MSAAAGRRGRVADALSAALVNVMVALAVLAVLPAMLVLWLFGWLIDLARGRRAEDAGHDRSRML